jgi:ribonuclease P protein subunit POP4
MLKRRKKMKGEGYQINEKNLKNHELIGLKVRVIESSDPGKKDIGGKIIDETKNTIVLENGKILPKKECVFEFDIGKKVLIDGKKIMKRPVDRLKD